MTDRPQVRTGPLGGNQAQIDELEYFIESLGRYLFGGEGEDFRRLQQYVPRTRNVSALISMFRTDGAGRDIAEDMGYLLSELETRVGGAQPSSEAPESRTVFRYGRYRDLVQRPERLLESVPPERRLEVTNLLSRGSIGYVPTLARLNAYAWLCVLGLPNLEAELGSGREPGLDLIDWSVDMTMGLARILASAEHEVGPGLSAYFHSVQRDFYDDYRGQLARYAARTQPL